MNYLFLLIVFVPVVLASNSTTDRDIFGMHEYDADDKNRTRFNASFDSASGIKDDTNCDGYKVDAVLSNEQEFRKYVRCLLDDGDKNCTPEGKLMKGTLPDALATDCIKCTREQKAAIDKIVRYLLNRRHDVWERLEVRYDPSGAYWAKYEALYSRPDFHL